MRRRLLDLCLLAYPRASRSRDRDYLRDLALDLAETQGFARQALSVLGGGLRERVEIRRRMPSAGLGAWFKRIAVASLVLAALASVVTGLIGFVEDDAERVRELERLTCVEANHPGSERDRGRVNGVGTCTEEKGLVAARVQAGWGDCASRRRARHGQRKVAWRCTRGQGMAVSRAS